MTKPGFAIAALLALAALSAQADPAALRERCLASIEAGGTGATRAALDETLSVATDAHSHLFQFTAKDGGVYSCQLCDDRNPEATCATVGVDLAYRPADGELRRLPAELDRKCAHDLVRELGTPEQRMQVRHDVLARIVTSKRHTAQRRVYDMALDGTGYRCVIRTSDGSYRVERRDGEHWRAIAAGTYW